MAPEQLAERAINDARARTAWGALVETAEKLVGSLRVGAPAPARCCSPGAWATSGVAAVSGAPRRGRPRLGPATGSSRLARKRRRARRSSPMASPAAGIGTWSRPSASGGPRHGARPPVHGGRGEVRRRLRAPARVLLAGLTTRAIAESAVRAGRVVTVDYFGDLDRSASRDTSAAGARAAYRPRRSSRRRAASGTTPSPIPAGWRTIPRWWQGPHAIGCCSAMPPTRGRVRDPRFSSRTSGPRVRRSRHARRHPPSRDGPVAPQAVARGRRSLRTRLARRAPRATPILQQHVEGRPRVGLVRGRRPPGRGARLERAAPRAAVPVRGQHPAAEGGAAAREGRAISHALAAGYGLRGLNGVDFVLRGTGRSSGGEPPLLRLDGAGRARPAPSVFGLHLAACRGELPEPRRRSHGPCGERRSSTPPARSRPRPRSVAGRGACATSPTPARSFAPATPSAPSSPRARRGLRARPALRSETAWIRAACAPVDQPAGVDDTEEDE